MGWWLCIGDTHDIGKKVAVSIEDDTPIKLSHLFIGHYLPFFRDIVCGLSIYSDLYNITMRDLEGLYGPPITGL